MLDICFTADERRQAGSDFSEYALRWALKEAASKALGTGILTGVGLRDIEVTGRRPSFTLVLRANALQVARRHHLYQWLGSGSIYNGFAVGAVIASD
jgi:phosphopantetheinyl transferase (holo-ACP synthase)